ncbi:MAG: single-stranded-DNA-specific exonuclease RecJ [Nitrospinae bacterium]|nr:single-stranded-DNA-specific exonuclease RecJ [Nitrospinota bacterium]
MSDSPGPLAFPRKWTLRPVDNESAGKLSRELNVPPLVGRLLAQRGIQNPGEARIFLDAPLAGLHDPFLMKGMEQAVSHLVERVGSRRPIGVYGDYDVDGISATALLCRFFTQVGVRVPYYIPNRLDEGYGLHRQGLEKLKEAGCDTVVTVDCGISAHAAAMEAERMGVRLIITDHHRPPDELPHSVAVLNPRRRGCEYPFRGLSGVGVAFKLITALRRRLHEGGFTAPLPNLKQHLDLVALGTVADVVPLRDENHIFVRHGLGILSPPEVAEGGFETLDRRKAGIRALQAAANLKAQTLNVGHISFSIAPRLNAAGRVGEASLGVELLIADDEGEARARAEVLEEWNRQRQNLQHQAWEEAMAIMGSSQVEAGDEAIVLASDKWHPGVVGIVAAKLAEEYHQPAVLIHLKDGVGKGSVRSASGLHVYEALERCSDLLLQFGGHKGAAGLKVAEREVDAFRGRFREVIRGMRKSGADERELMLDARVDFSDMDVPLLEQLEGMAPFGEENPRPVFCASRVEVVGSAGSVGREGEHLKLNLRQFRDEREAIGFGMGALLEEPERLRGKLDVAFSPGLNRWRGNTRIQLELRAMRPAGG